MSNHGFHKVYKTNKQLCIDIYLLSNLAEHDPEVPEPIIHDTFLWSMKLSFNREEMGEICAVTDFAHVGQILRNFTHSCNHVYCAQGAQVWWGLTVHSSTTATLMPSLFILHIVAHINLSHPHVSGCISFSRNGFICRLITINNEIKKFDVISDISQVRTTHQQGWNSS